MPSLFSSVSPLKQQTKALLFALCAATASVLSASVHAQTPAPLTPSGMPPSGARILNQAEATYEAQGFTQRISSNPVRLFVSPVEALSLTQPNERRAAPGSPVALPHRLVNTGNIAATLALDVSAQSGDFSLEALRLVRDLNSNGLADLGEPAMTASDTLALEPGSGADFVVMGRVPASQVAQSTANVQLVARSLGQNASAANVDRVLVSPGAALSVRKSATPANASRGELVTWTLTANSTGAVSPEPIELSINGAPTRLVVLRDLIPANTTFDSATGSPDARATVLYHRLGDALHAYSTTPLAPVDALAWGLTSFEPGTTLVARFAVRINANASGGISNTALLFSRTGEATGQAGDQSTASNRVEIGVPLAPPTLSFYTDSTFSKVALVTGVGRDLWLQGDSSSCNSDPLVAEHVTISLHSTLTNDSIQVPATETSPNSGIFRADSAVATSGGSAVAGDRTLQIAPNDELSATLAGCGTSSASAQILVDPFGVVFDSRSGTPIAGARVTLIDTSTGAPARVFDFDGLTPAPSTVVTGADGAFRFPSVAPGNYRLDVVTPQGFSTPSKVPATLLPTGRLIDLSGSYGGEFSVSVAGGPVRLDVPLDGPQGTGLFLQKAALVRDAEIGGTVEYALTLKNVAGLAMTGALIRDTLPRGFSFVKGTARRDAATTGASATALADPTLESDRTLVFSIGDLAASAQSTIRYRVRIGAGSVEGRAINRARATGTTPIQNFTSNEATAEVRVRGGVFTTRAILIGKIWIDTNKNQIQERDEIPVPGVRVFLENGNYAVSDRDGKYSIYGALPLTHIVKVDAATLPAGAVLEQLTTMHARSGRTAFADLKNGEMQKVDFALVTPTEDVSAEVARRIAAGDPAVPELEARLRTGLPVAPTVVRSGDEINRSGPASGTLGAGGIVPDGNVNTSRTTNNPIERERDGAQTPVVPPAQIDTLKRRTASQGPLDGNFGPVPSPSLPAGGESLETQIKNAANGDLAILGLENGQLLASDNINVRVKGTVGANIKLFLNGQEQSDKRIGTRSTDEARGIQGLEWIALKLKPGANDLRAAQTDGFGNARGEVKISIVSPGSAGQIALVLPGRGAPADGLTPVSIGVKVFDAGGNRVSARTFLTLETTAGRWNTPDLNATEPGVQVALEGGQGTFQLLPPDVPARAVVRVSAGLLQSEGELAFTPFLRPVLAAGLVETQIGGGKNGVSTSAFERELSHIGSKNIGGRGAVYLKGSIQGKYLLSLRYDSQNFEDKRLFRDIQPDEFYPVYGDSSLKGFDAQSTSQLYVRLDKDNSFALYGDFSTFAARSGASSDANSLSRYSRSLTGVQAHAENKSYSATTFAARQNTSRRVFELRANGTSGPYTFPDTQVRPQSERVEIIVRDRNNPGVVLQVREQTRFSDYTLDGFLTGLLFKAPVPSFDQDGNPVFVRIAYELDAGGPTYSVAGGLVQGKLGNNLQVGISFVRDGNPDNGSDLAGANAALRLSKDTVLIGEVARTSGSNSTRAGQDKNGNAERLELRKDGKNVQVRAFVGRADAGFNNAESVLTAGRGEAGVRASVKVGARTAVSAEAISTKDLTSGAKTSGAQLALDQAISNDTRLSLGVRTGQGDQGATFGGSGTGNVDFTSVFARLNARVPGVPQANVFVRGEETLNGGGSSLAVGGDYQIAPRTRLYAAHEFFNSPLSLYALGDTERRFGTRVGVETQYARGASLFSEYRIAGSIEGRSAEAAIGLRNTWRVGRGIGLSTTFETTRRLAAFALGATTANQFNTGSDGTAVSLGLENLRDDRFKWTARAERRGGSGQNSTLLNAGFALSPSRDLTFLGRGAYSNTSGAGGVLLGNAARTQTRLQFGAAYRPSKSDRFNALGKIEYRGGDDPDGLSTQLRRRVTIASGDFNYGYTRSVLAQLHIAAKRASDTDAFNDSTSAALVSGRLTRDFGRRMSLSLLGASLWSRPGGRQNSLGLEGSYALTSDLLFSLGYNWSRLNERDLLGDTSANGFYVRFRWRFDEDLLSGLGAFNQAPVASTSKPFVPVQNGGFGGGVVFDGGTTAALDGLTGTGGTYSAPRLGG